MPATHGLRRTRLHLSRMLATVLLVAAIQPGFAAEPGFNVPREEILAKIRRVGFLPFEFAGDWPRNTAAAAELEALTTEILAKAGIQTVPYSQYAGIEARIREEEGGWFDPQTGRTITEKRNAMLQKARAELAAKHQLDGFVKVWVDVVRAPVSGGDARWQGAREGAQLPYKRRATLDKFMDTTSGSVPALAVAVALFDLRPDNQLFGLYGGLQLLSLSREVKGRTEFLDVTEEFILADPVRNSRAVRIALRPLVMTKEQIKAEDAAFRKQREAAIKATPDKTQMIDDDGRLLATPVVAEPKAAPVAPQALRLPLVDLVQRAGTIALAPTSIDIGRQLPDRAARIETALTSALESAGFKVVPSDIYRATYQRLRETMGPYFDPLSGKLLQERVDALKAAVFEELRAQHQIGGIAHPTVLQVTATHDGKKLRWDGVSQSIVQGGNVLAELNAFANNGFSGTAQAISLRLRLSGPQDEEYFLKQTGVQSLQRMSGGGKPVDGSYLLVNVKDEELLVDAAMLATATNLLTQELRPTAAPK